MNSAEEIPKSKDKPIGFVPAYRAAVGFTILATGVLTGVVFPIAQSIADGTQTNTGMCGLGSGSYVGIDDAIKLGSVPPGVEFITEGLWAQGETSNMAHLCRAINNR